MRVIVHKDNTVQLYQLIHITERNFNHVQRKLKSDDLKCAFEQLDWETQREQSLVFQNVKWLE